MTRPYTTHWGRKEPLHHCHFGWYCVSFRYAWDNGQGATNSCVSFCLYCCIFNQFICFQKNHQEILFRTHTSVAHTRCFGVSTRFEGFSHWVTRGCFLRTRQKFHHWVQCKCLTLTSKTRPGVTNVKTASESTRLCPIRTQLYTPTGSVGISGNKTSCFIVKPISKYFETLSTMNKIKILYCG